MKKYFFLLVVGCLSMMGLFLGLQDVVLADALPLLEKNNMEWQKDSQSVSKTNDSMVNYVSDASIISSSVKYDDDSKQYIDATTDWFTHSVSLKLPDLTDGEVVTYNLGDNASMWDYSMKEFDAGDYTVTPKEGGNFEIRKKSGVETVTSNEITLDLRLRYKENIPEETEIVQLKPNLTFNGETTFGESKDVTIHRYIDTVGDKELLKKVSLGLVTPKDGEEDEGRVAWVIYWNYSQAELNATDDNPLIFKDSPNSFLNLDPNSILAFKVPTPIVDGERASDHGDYDAAFSAYLISHTTSSGTAVSSPGDIFTVINSQDSYYIYFETIPTQNEPIGGDISKIPKGDIRNDAEISAVIGDTGSDVVIQEDQSGAVVILPDDSSGGEKLIVSGTKTWVDNDNFDTTRPDSIIVNLLANGVVGDSQTVTADANGDWTYEFTDLPVKDSSGNTIVYTVSENEVPGYTTTIQGTNIVNTLKSSSTTKVSGTKTWVDNDNFANTRPDSIIVNLLANGVVGDSQTVTADANGDWTYEFIDLPVKDSSGNTIVYTVTENEVPGYTTTIQGTNIVNTLKSTSTTSVSGTKTWVDNDNFANTRPDSIIVNLLANGVVLDSQTVTAGANGDWTYEFTNLPVTDSSGNTIVYTVSENEVPGYTTTIKGTNIENTLKSTSTTSVSGTKTWVDNNNSGNTRPDSIIVNLLANGVISDSQTVTADTNGDWTYEFTDLPVTDSSGNTVVYTVSENAVKGYTTTIQGTNIVNTLKSTSTTSVSGTKTWVDNNNSGNTRPDSIVVNLLDNGVVIDSQTVKPDVNGDWTYEFTNLPVTDSSGNTIVYTVSENAVMGYTASIQGTNIVNTLKSTSTTSVSGTKTWVDNDNSGNTRPDSIVVNLLANGVVVDSQTVKPDVNGDWTYEFINLPVTDSSGNTIVYTVSENEVSGYTTTVQGTNIVNTLKSTSTTSVSGIKTWVDNNNSGNTRPDSIVVNLLANGVVVDSQTVKPDVNGDWMYDFTELPLIDSAGNEITYTISEDAVSGYITTVQGTDLINTYDVLVNIISGDGNLDNNNGTTSGQVLPQTGENLSVVVTIIGGMILLVVLYVKIGKVDLSLF